jgi:hypothetical protein
MMAHDQMINFLEVAVMFLPLTNAISILAATLCRATAAQLGSLALRPPKLSRRSTKHVTEMTR